MPTQSPEPARTAASCDERSRSTRRVPRARVPNRLLATLLTLSFLVLLWRVSALVVPSTIIVVTPETRVWLTMLGIIFLGSGTLVFARRNDALARYFLIYCLGGAIHWGGAVGGPYEVGFLLVYVAATYSGEVSLLALALALGTTSQERFRRWLHAPALAVIVLAPFGLWIERRVAAILAAVLLGVAAVLALLAGVVFLRKALQRDLDPRSRSAARVIAASLLTFTAIAALGRAGWLAPNAALPSDVYNLALAGIPLSLAFVLTRLPTAPELPGAREETRSKG